MKFDEEELEIILIFNSQFNIESSFRESYSNSSVKRKKKKANVLETSGGGRGQDFSHLTITNQPKGFLPKVLYHGATGSPLRTKHSRKS